MRLRIARKEAKETAHWIQLMDISPQVADNKAELLREATELKLILSAMIRNTEDRKK